MPLIIIFSLLLAGCAEVDIYKLADDGGCYNIKGSSFYKSITSVPKEKCESLGVK